MSMEYDCLTCCMFIGRTGPGVCYRLYAESDYNELQEYSTPEIQRVPIDGLILQMVAMGLPDARQFVFIEPPAASTVENSIATLKEQVRYTYCRPQR